MFNDLPSPTTSNGVISFQTGAAVGQTTAVRLKASGSTPAGLESTAVRPAPAAMPTITSFTPSSGAVGAYVTISGTNLTGATAATIGGIVAGRSNNTATSIRLQVPPGGVSGPITVTTAGGTATSATSFTVNTSGGATHTIAGFTPTTQQAGLTIAVTGTGFIASAVWRVCGVQASFTLNSATSVSVTIPAGINSVGKVTCTQNGATATSSGDFTLSFASTDLLAQVIFVGNSNVQGTTQGGGVDNGFVKYAQNLLPANNFQVVNKGVAGWTITNIENDVANVQAAYNPNPAVQKILFFLEWTNSGRSGVDPSGYYTRQRDYLNARRAEGCLVVPITALPQDSASHDVLNQGAQSINGSLRANPQHYDYLLDASLNTSTGRFSPSSADDPTNYPDGTHLSVRSEKILGRMAYDIICKLVYGTAVPNPVNYPPDEVLPGDNTVWAIAQGLIVNAAPDDNTLYNTPNSPQYGGQAQSGISYPRVEGQIVFAEATAAAAGFGFFNLCNGFGGSNVGAWVQQGITWFNGTNIGLWSDGGYVGGFGAPVGAGDRLRIEAHADSVAGDKLIFYRNGTPMYTLTKPIIYPLRVSAVSPGGGIGGPASALLNVKEGVV